MNELNDTKLKRPMDRSIAGAEVAGLNALIGMLNNPDITGAVVPAGEATKVDSTRITKEDAKGIMEEYFHPAPAAEEAVPAPAPVRSNASKLFFTGKLRAGKDHVAKAAGSYIFGFADPIYEIASQLTGIKIDSSHGKDLPGIRALLQAIGQWGRNEVNAQYPITPARILFVQMMRNTPGYENFGENKNIWIDNLMARWQTWAADNDAKRAAVTNARFENEFKSLTAAGWTHWHVMCSPATWAARLAAAKLTPQSPAVLDTSEQLAAALDADVIKQISAQKNGPKLRCIWNDDSVKPPSARLHTLPSFLQTLAIEEIPATPDDSDILTGE